MLNVAEGVCNHVGCRHASNDVARWLGLWSGEVTGRVDENAGEADVPCEVGGHPVPHRGYDYKNLPAGYAYDSDSGHVLMRGPERHGLKLCSCGTCSPEPCEDDLVVHEICTSMRGDSAGCHSGNEPCAPPEDYRAMGVVISCNESCWL